jgi:hypothetical protein
MDDLQLELIGEVRKLHLGDSIRLVTPGATALALPSLWLPRSCKSLRSHGFRNGLSALFTVALLLTLALTVLLTMRILSGPKTK